MSQTRNLTSTDLPQVVQLLQRHLLKKKTRQSAFLRSYLDRLFLQHPEYDEEIASRVVTAKDGTIKGFLGVLPVRMRHHGEDLRAGVATALVVDDPDNNPLTGALLQRSLFKGPQDLTFTETAIAPARKMWLQAGGTTAPGYSIDWTKILRPAGYTVCFARHRFPPAALLRPLGRMTDHLLVRTKRSPLGDEGHLRKGLTAFDASENDLANVIPQLMQDYALHPQINERTLKWIISHSARKDAYGPIASRTLLDRAGRPVGLSIYHGKSGGIAHVLQIMARPGHHEAVIADLFIHAFKRGCIAVKGGLEPGLFDALQQQNCLFRHSVSTLVHSRNKDLLSTIRAGDAFIKGLAGENWTPLIGHI